MSRENTTRDRDGSDPLVPGGCGFDLNFDRCLRNPHEIALSFANATLGLLSCTFFGNRESSILAEAMGTTQMASIFIGAALAIPVSLCITGCDIYCREQLTSEEPIQLKNRNSRVVKGLLIGYCNYLITAGLYSSDEYTSIAPNILLSTAALFLLPRFINALEVVGQTCFNIACLRSQTLHSAQPAVTARNSAPPSANVAVEIKELANNSEPPQLATINNQM